MLHQMYKGAIKAILLLLAGVFVHEVVAQNNIRCSR